MRRLPAAVALAVAAALATACGSSSGSGAEETGRATAPGARTTPAPAATAPMTTAPAAMAPAAADEPAAEVTARARGRRGVVVKRVASDFGPIVADGRGQAFYLFDRERSTRPRCYGACARAWPPVLARGVPVAGRGARASLLGTTRRADGRVQLTYAGRPMYYYVADSPGVVLCQDVFEYGGRWLVVRPDGAAVT